MSSRRSAGKSGGGSNWTPRQRYLLDNSLNPYLAAALRLAGWDVVSVNEWFAADPRQSVVDEDIIRRCGQEGRASITADDAARGQHEVALKWHLVSVLWVSRPKGGMSTTYQHALLTSALLRFDYLLSGTADCALHHRVGSTLHAVPVETWRRRRALT
jgi:PIN like domain